MLNNRMLGGCEFTVVTPLHTVVHTFVRSIRVYLARECFAPLRFARWNG